MTDLAFDAHLSVADVAEILGVSETTVRRLLDARKLGHVVIDGRRMVPRAELAAYIERQTIPAVEACG